MTDPAAPPPRTALLLGATGLVGRRCLAHLLAHPAWTAVTALARRPTGVAHPRLREVVAAPLEPARLDPAHFACDDLVVALGTTLRAAGSREAFRRVDHDLVLDVARRARAAGARRVALVSSVGADARASAFYLRTKGEVEDALAALGFEQTELLRPSLLVGARAERRPLEAVGVAAASGLRALLGGTLRRYRPIDADVVARAAVAALAAGTPGVHVRAYDALEELARALPPGPPTPGGPAM